MSETGGHDRPQREQVEQETAEWETVEEETPEEETPEEETSVPRDWRAVIVAGSGLCALAVLGVVGLIAIPESVPKGEVSTKGENIVAICAAAFTAVGTVLSAYFGIKAANLAREDSTAAAERNEIRTAELAGAEPTQAGEASRRASKRIREQGLHRRR